jgi:exopolysaccharide biosynthesis polyprenyl glycosylphosphotransferase
MQAEKKAAPLHQERVHQKAFTYPAHRRGPNYALVSYLVDIILTQFALVMAGTVLRFYAAEGATRTPGIVFTFAALVWTVNFFLLSIYDPNRTHEGMEEDRKVFIAVGLSTLILLGTLYLSDMLLPRSFTVSFFVIDAVLLIGWRVASRVSRYVIPKNRAAAPQKLLIIGANELGKQVVDIILPSASNMEIFGFLDDEKRGTYGDLPVVGNLSETRRIVEQNGIEEVVVALPHRSYDKLNQIVMDLQSLPVQVRVVPSYLSLALYRATVADLGGLPLINLRDTALTPQQRMVKRAFDVVVSSVLMLMILPVLGAIALAIRMDSDGPVFFKQTRVGENGKLFKMYKFRSMVVNAEALQAQLNVTDIDGNTIHKHRNDPRVTRMGRILRKTSLDELPQFINVILGDMSLVGPRPELPWLVEEYQPWQRQRFAVPQGITGWWQVNGRSDKPCHLNTDQDLYYIQNYSFLLDLQILFRTVPALLKGKGAF